MQALRERLANTDINLVKEDILRFHRTDPRTLDIWSNDYFLMLADQIVFQ